MHLMMATIVGAAKPMDSGFQIADRLFLSSLVVFIVLLSYFEPGSIQHQMAHISGWPAHVSLVVLTFLTSLVVLDTVNDVFGFFRLRIRLYCRQLVWMFIASTLAGYAYVLLRMGIGYWSALWYIIFSMRCVSVAFLDLKHEAKNGGFAERTRACAKSRGSSTV